MGGGGEGDDDCGGCLWFWVFICGVLVGKNWDILFWDCCFGGFCDNNELFFELMIFVGLGGGGGILLRELMGWWVLLFVWIGC